MLLLYVERVHTEHTIALGENASKNYVRWTTRIYNIDANFDKP